MIACRSTHKLKELETYFVQRSSQATFPFRCHSHTIVHSEHSENRKHKNRQNTTAIHPVVLRRWNLCKTRMHSSRMRTVCLLTVSRSTGGGCLPGDGGVCSGVSVWGGCLPPLVNRMTDRQVQRHYLPATSFAGGNNLLETKQL